MHASGRSVVVVSLLITALGAVAPQVRAQTCADDVYSGTLGCNASDTSIVSISATNVTDPCTGAGDSATADINITLSSTAQNRYNIGFYIAQDGGNALTGSCLQGFLTPVGTLNGPYNPSSGSGPYLNANGDVCGDLAQNESTLITLPNQVFPCTDSDNDGNLDVGTVIVWSQNQNDVCTGTPVLPGNNTKCTSTTFVVTGIPVPTRTPTSTVTDTVTATATATRTGTATATSTATAVNTATQTPTVSATPTNTPVSTATSTATSTNTPVSTATSTNTPIDTATNTATSTNTPVNTATSTATPTNTPVDTATSTATSTNTPVNTAISTATPTNTPVDTATSTATSTNTPVSTTTSTATATDTPVSTASSTPTVTNTPLSTASSTPTITQTVANTPTGTPFNSPTATATFEDITPLPVEAPNIKLFKSFPGLCRPSTTTTFTLSVRNIGEIATSGPITVTDPMPAGMTLVQAVGSGWNCAGSTAAQLLCSRPFPPALAPGAAAPTITATVTIAANASPVLINTAFATTPGDLDQADGTSTAFCRRNPVPAPAASPLALGIGLVMLIGVAALAIRRRFG